MEDKNHIDRIWEELTFLLEDDPFFRIGKISNNRLHIYCRKKESFHDIPIMGRIFGRIMFFNCVLNIEKKTILDETSILNDQMVYIFQFILKERIKYSGSVIVYRSEN